MIIITAIRTKNGNSETEPDYLKLKKNKLNRLLGLIITYNFSIN